ncbi:GrpB family protein [Occultella kanbiaonis]|uniref:GrpB family protein n=1 Tax=Occultella kanbiaonis TaxID=2675754 RepID=UPI001B356B17|nr:GrpB family protein [Occultella kanbiaonis]
MNDGAPLIADYDPRWPAEFAELAGKLRASLGGRALRIDHIGSTAVPRLAAKPILDVQISVTTLEPVDAYREQIEQCGFEWRSANPERTKRYFRELPGRRRTHVHVRRAGSFSEQFALLFRDYLRAHPKRADVYAVEKRHLAPLLRVDRGLYVKEKDPIVWDIIRLADAWAQSAGWEPGPSDG